jgi:large subunit ribosomal protein L24
MQKIKIGDTVKVIQGDEKGKTGKVTRVLVEDKKIIVDGINNKIKHVKPSQKDKVGKIINFYGPIHISNVMLCNENGITSKVGFIIQNEKKIRILKKTKELIQQKIS